jgi:cellulose biosynthesis protein BcsQ
VGVAVLSEISEFVKRLVEVWNATSPDALAVVLAGTAMLGGAGGWYAHRMREKPVLTGPTAPPDPTPEAELITRILAAVDQEDGSLWRFHPARQPQEALRRLKAARLPIVTFANLKGGVAKTTHVANLAAYYAKSGKRVLAIDLDYQGSLSAMLLRPAAMPIVESLVDKVLSRHSVEPCHLPASIAASKIRGTLSVLTASLSLNRAENDVFMRWLLTPTPTLDFRYALAEYLGSNGRENSFDIVWIDTPPRLTAGTINALTASSHFVIPTILDEVAIGNIGTLLKQIRELLKNDLNPGLDFVGVLPTMTSTANMNANENRVLGDADELAARNWPSRTTSFTAFVPDKVGVARAATESIAVLSDTGATGSSQYFEAVGQELAKRIGLAL